MRKPKRTRISASDPLEPKELEVAKKCELDPEFQAMLQRMRDGSPKIRESVRRLRREIEITQRTRSY